MHIYNDFPASNQKLATFDSNLILVDNNEFFLESFCNSILSNYKLRFIRNAYSGEEFIYLIQSGIYTFDFVILDIDILGFDGLELIKFLFNFNQQNKIQSKFAILTSTLNLIKLKCSLEYGAIAIIDKSGNTQTLIQEIGRVLIGETVFSQKYKFVKDLLNDENGKPILTNRELEVMYYLCNFENENSIAKKLSISINTVSNHKKNVMKKFNVKTHVELIGFFDRFLKTDAKKKENEEIHPNFFV